MEDIPIFFLAEVGVEFFSNDGDKSPGCSPKVSTALDICCDLDESVSTTTCGPAEGGETFGRRR